MYKTRYIIVLFVILVAFSLPNAQYYFGKNKIQYTDYQWEVLKTEHFNIYFYSEEHELAKIAAQLAEDSYTDLSYKFNFVVDVKVPLIIYSAPNLFQETNTVSYILPEGVGGFTEFYKGRVVVPFNGSHSDFRHVIRHELVHIFTLYKLEHILDTHDIFFFEFPPLWFIEGIAEYWSVEDKSEGINMIRSAVLEEEIVPITEYERIYGSFLMYKEGEYFLQFIEDYYGKGRLQYLFENWWKSRDFYYTFKEAIGVDLEEADNMWLYHLKKKYYPDLNKGTIADIMKDPITETGYNLSPVVWRQDSTYKIIFKGDRMGYTGIYSIENKGKIKLLMKGDMSEPFESLHLFRNRISVNNGGLMAFSAKSEGGDILYVYDIENGRTIINKRFERITSIISPSISPDGRKIAFSGFDLSGFVDIYVYDRKTDELIKLTDDYFDDKNPVWNPANGNVLFTSNRIQNGDEGNYGLCEIDPDTRDIAYFIFPDGDIIYPVFSDDGERLLFSADFDSIFNLYMVKDSLLYKISNVLTGVYEADWIDEDTVVASVFTHNSYQFYKIAVPDTKKVICEVYTEKWEPSWSPEEKIARRDISTVKYDRALKLDIAQGAVATQAGMESGGGLEGVFTDMLGDHQLYFLVYNQAQEVEDILRNFNLIVTYYNVKNRPNWGGGVYHLFTKDYNRIEGSFEEENAGVMGIVSYPFSRFHRVDAKLFLQYARKDYYWEGTQYEGGMANLHLSYIRDNAIWESVGPIEGMRLNLTGGITTDITEARFLSWLASIDMRNYLRISRRTCFATRVVARYSGGELPERFYMGGTWSFRGYPWFSFYGRKMLLINNEYRFPLIDRLILGLPVLRINISGIKGALFFDAGQTWEDDNLDLLGSFGVSLRVNLGYYTVLRTDFAKRTDFNIISDDIYFDVFFGWNY
ncbi:PD40 domain-containing protein [bacterium]|nr:PD40 domain-containing protein [bacterium]